jgi:hypothetical protein
MNIASILNALKSQIGEAGNAVTALSRNMDVTNAEDVSQVMVSTQKLTLLQQLHTTLFKMASDLVKFVLSKF